MTRATLSLFVAALCAVSIWATIGTTGGQKPTASGLGAVTQPLQLADLPRLTGKV
jgi:hypothetical protein